MKNKKTYKFKKEANKVSEPIFPYHSIRKSNFEALEEENRLYSVMLSPLQRLSYLMELNINAFGRKSLEIRDFGKDIKQK